MHLARRRDRHTLALLIALAIAGLAVVLAGTQWGAGATPDTASYLSAARNLQQGRGLRVESDIHQSQEFYSSGRFEAAVVSGTSGSGVISLPLTQYPPLFSVLLALPGLVGWVGADPLRSARWLDAILFAATILVVGIAIYQHTRTSPGPAVAGALLLLLCPDVLTLHIMAWSEPLFVCCTFTALLLLAAYLDGAPRGCLGAAAGAAAGAGLTRYVGVVLILLGGLALVGLSRKDRRGRLGEAALFMLLAGLPVLAWLGRNTLVAGSPANRDLVYHPVPGAALAQAVVTLGHWLLPVSALDGPLLDGAALLGVVGALAGSLWALGRGASAAWPPGPLRRLSALLGLFIGLYGTFLLLSISLYDAATPLDGRLLSPVFVAGLMLVVTHLHWWLGPRLGAWPWRVGAVALAGLYGGLYLGSSIPLIQSAHDRGLGYSDAAWQQSPTMQRLREQPPNALVYTNGPDAVYVLTGRGVNLLPPKANIYTEESNGHYAAQMALLREQARQRPVLVVYFDTIFRGYLPGAEELRHLLPLRVVAHGADGTIYQIDAGGPRP